MVLGEIKMKSSLKTGLLFFILLSLLSNALSVDPTSPSSTDSTTTSPSSTDTTTTSPSTTDTTTTTSSLNNPTSYSTDLMASTSPSPSTSPSTSPSSSTSPSPSTSMNTTNSSSSETGNYSTVSCPAFVCTTDCSFQLMNATANPCPSNSGFCEVMKQNMSYSVNCTASCGLSCGNTTTDNCSLKCCNSTNCINNTVLTLNNLVSTTVATASTTSTTMAMPPVTQANNGKKCHNIKCDGAACYKPISTVMMCPVGQDYCMLKKTTTGTTESWQGGCSDDCRKMTVCSATVTTCYLECCNATSSASCLKLSGEVNMPSSASRGLQSPALLMASLLLLWTARVFT